MLDHPLRKWRKRNGVILSDFAKQIGSTASSISRIERNHQSPSLALLMKICVATQHEITLFDFYLNWDQHDNKA